MSWRAASRPGFAGYCLRGTHPDRIYAIPEVPKTLNDKKLEVPVKRIITGAAAGQVINRDAMSNPDSLEFFVELGREFFRERPRQLNPHSAFAWVAGGGVGRGGGNRTHDPLLPKQVRFRCATPRCFDFIRVRGLGRGWELA